MQSVVDQFALLLAKESDPAKRKGLIKRAEMKALNEITEEQLDPPITTLGDYLANPIPVPPSLVWPTTIVRGEITATLGRAGYGKTTMNLNRLIRWAAGLPWFDTFKNSDGEHYLNPSDPLKVLIIENEGSAGLFQQKIATMVDKGDFGLDHEDLIKENVLIWGDGGYSGLKIDEAAQLHQVRTGVEKWEPDVIFIEPFRSLWKGNENDSTEMANMVDNLQAMATDYGCGVIISHHERKSGTGEGGELMDVARGSTVLEGVANVMENFQKTTGGEYREITWSKSRYLPPPPPTRMQYDSETLWCRHVSNQEIDMAVLRVLEENNEDAMTIKEVASAASESQDRIRPILRNLVDEQRLVKLPSISTSDGNTGPRYRIKTNETQGGLEV